MRSAAITLGAVVLVSAAVATVTVAIALANMAEYAHRSFIPTPEV